MRKVTSLSSAVRALANAVVLLLVAWIVLDLLGANTGNILVHWIRNAADWLSVWSRGIFSVHSSTLQVLLDYGIAAAVYAAIGNLVIRTVR
ncbi:hypothetical protein GCM10009760_54360 [Kitasatospora kazusensis]|uniref:YGGT family protein n=1 Tax=Kitasatospora kazusensis TaxID=407974 RepID=A0ABP5M1H5_9ACTN